MPTASPAPTAVPIGTAVTSFWTVAKDMITDTINIVTSNPLLVTIIIAVPLIGIGVGLFNRLVRG